MTTQTASQARANLYRLIDEVADHHEPVVITGKRNNAVLISEEDWQAVQETIYLNAIPGMVESIHKAAKEPLEQGTELEDLDW